MIAGYKTTNPHTKEPTRFIEQILDGRKRHTMRRGERWKYARDRHRELCKPLYIQHCTGVRTKMFKEHHKHIVTQVQRVFMSYDWRLQISVNGQELNYWKFESDIWKNDGFKSAEDFENWFADDIQKNGDFIGEIIHWTDLRY